MEPWYGVRSALSIASEQGKLASVHELLEYASVCDLDDVQNSNLDFADEEGRSPISYAAGNGHFEITKLLLQHGASAHLPDLFGRAPLSWAAGAGHLSTVALLLSPQYNVDANSQDVLCQTPFFWACGKGHSEVVAMMLARNDISPVYPRDYRGNSPLAVAAANGHESVIRILLTYTEVIQDWVVTSWGEEMVKDEWKSYFPGEWTFGTKLAWDYKVSFLPQNKAMAYGHWNSAKLLLLHWEGLDMKKYLIPGNFKAEFEEAGRPYNQHLTTHVYDPWGTSGSFYPHERAAGGEAGMDAYDDDESVPTKKSELFMRGYEPLGASYPFEQAAGGRVGAPAHNEHSPLDHYSNYLPCSQPVVGSPHNPYLTTHVYDPSGISGSFYLHEQAAGGEAGMDAYDDDEPGATKKPELFMRGYDPLHASYPFEQAAVGEVGMPAHNEYISLDDCSNYFPCSQPAPPAAAAATDDDDGHFEAEVQMVLTSYDDEFFGPNNYTYAQSSIMSGGQRPIPGEAINYHHHHHHHNNNNYNDDSKSNNNNNKDTLATQTAITTKKQSHRKRYKKAKAMRNVVNVAK